MYEKKKAPQSAAKCMRVQETPPVAYHALSFSDPVNVRLAVPGGPTHYCAVASGARLTPATATAPALQLGPNYDGRSAALAGTGAQLTKVPWQSTISVHFPYPSFTSSRFANGGIESSGSGETDHLAQQRADGLARVASFHHDNILARIAAKEPALSGSDRATESRADVLFNDLDTAMSQSRARVDNLLDTKDNPVKCPSYNIAGVGAQFAK
ncbi:hypothetical protein G7046_g6475 [Stylonectria norvegica]|nr:hypothetical protein G7046_g6475 [Stylonectria norvegica]